jgi:REP element-mobilizing transposase RayT
MVHSELGGIVAESLQKMPVLNPGISLHGWVVMPDHVHFNCHLAAGLDEPLKVLGNAIRRFKNYTTKMAKRLVEHSSTIFTGASNSIDPAITTTSGGLAKGKAGYGREASEDGRTAFGQYGQFWQQGYHDHLCLSRNFIDSTERYIAYNPMKWELMHGYDDCLRIVEPLISPRLDPADWWKGVGNTGLLGNGEKIVALRVSRKVNTPSGIADVVDRMEKAVAKGYVILGGFISPGEKAVRDMLCRNSNAKFIRILPSSIPNRRFRPESQYIEPFAQGRYLEIAKGNDEVNFDRSACLDLNDEIVKIAKSGEGCALYVKG